MRVTRVKGLRSWPTYRVVVSPSMLGLMAKNHLAGAFFIHSMDELTDVELLRANAIHR